MKHIVTFVTFLCIFHPLYSMMNDMEENTPPQYAQLQPQSSVLNTLITQPFNATYRSIQYWCGLNDMDWQLLYAEQEESNNIVTLYFENISKGIDNPTITHQYTKRSSSAIRVAEKLTRKLAIFCTNYEKSPKKVFFLTEHNDEWKQITQTDIERAQFLVEQYPNRLLSTEIIAELKKRHEKIKEIVESIENTNKK